MKQKAQALEERKVTWIREQIRFLDRQTLEAGGKRIRAGKVVLASGSKPIRPPISGVEHTIDSTQILQLTRIPPRVVVIGGGVIAMEFASIFGHVGSQVTVLEATPHVLGGVDRDVRAAIERMAPSWHVAIHTGAEVTRVARVDGSLAVTAKLSGKEQRFDAETVLLAVGRGPRVDGLDVEKAGVVVEKHGVRTDDYLETDAAGIYAAGDVHGRFQLSPLADYEGKLAARNALGEHKHTADYRVVPQTIFTIPSASSVGLTDAEARDRGIDYVASTLEFAKIGPAVVTGKGEGFVKVLLDRGSGELIGAHIVGHESEELIHEAALAMRARMTRDQLLATIPIHPSLSEALFGAITSAKTGHEESCCG